MKKYRSILIVVLLAILFGTAYAIYQSYRKNQFAGFASGNGRLEATEINIAAKIAGRIEAIYVKEGDYVKKNQLLARMQTNVLEAQLAKAEADLQIAQANEASAETMIDARKREKDAAQATLDQRISSLDGLRKRFARAQTLEKAQAASVQEFEDSETQFQMAQAAKKEAEVKVRQCSVMISAAEANAQAAQANVLAAQASIAQIKADISDCYLTAPLDGRIQYRIAEPGEVLSAGGKVLNMIDLTDVYMNFFLPSAQAGKVANGAEARILLDALPGIPLPATITFVASEAQFTPKTVETRSEREKLMFRIKAKLPEDLLQKYIQWVKTGVPGVAWVRLNPDAPWPEELQYRRK
ncbi:MAG: efflux RND transporter periplasmic adaptor subunit [Lentisphaeria bacterium]|nr:efflux RND transporter periplasmic adaptor subunit [Lentisphaeria bacterium]